MEFHNGEEELEYMYKTIIEFGDRKIISRERTLIAEGRLQVVTTFDDGTTFTVSDGENDKPRISCNRELSAEMQDGHIYKIIID